MSQEAQAIEEARRVYVQARGTPDEKIAYAYFLAVVERVKKAGRK